MELQAKRLGALKKIAEATASEHVIAWLVDAPYKTPMLLASYYFGNAPKLSHAITNATVPIVNNEQLPLDYDACELELKVALEEKGVNPDAIQCGWLKPIDRPTTVESQAPWQSALGVITYWPTTVAPQLIEPQLSEFAAIVEIGRSGRIVAAVSRAQELIRAGAGDTLNETFRHVGSLIRTALKCQHAYYFNRNTSGHWLEVTNLPKPVDSSMSETLESLRTSSGDITQKTCAKIGPEGDTEVHQEKAIGCIIVPLLQSAIKLSSAPFHHPSETLKAFARFQSNDVAMVFSEKRSTNYLQSRFSTTDLDLAKAVYNSVEAYAAARSFEEHYAAVAKFLRDFVADGPGFLKTLYHLLRALTVSLVAIHIVTVEIENGKISSIETEPPEIPPPGNNYLSRLTQQYFANFLSKHDRMPPDEMFIGADASQRHNYLEIHFSNGSLAARFLVLQFSDAVISESVLRSLILLFNELHVRFKKIEQKTEKASYITQVRHALVHHLTGAELALTEMKPMWDRGVRQPYIWASLLEDPIFPNLMGQSLWSLTQARLLIENGRFVLGEIRANTLNRKALKIHDIILDCMRSLSFLKDERRLRTDLRVKGTQPTLMNGDEILLKIAILNLLDNAFKYSRVRKTVLIDLEYKESSYVLKITSVSQLLNLGDRKKLLQMFSRGVQQDRLNLRHGTGLGLPVAYKILKAHSEMWLSDVSSG